jgi:hypothetical protein
VKDTIKRTKKWATDCKKNICKDIWGKTAVHKTLKSQQKLTLKLNKKSECTPHQKRLLVGMQNGTKFLEDSLLVSYKAKHTFATWSSNSIPWYLPKWVENLYSYTK